jgi:hypothetical protein
MDVVIVADVTRRRVFDFRVRGTLDMRSAGYS